MHEYVEPHLVVHPLAQQLNGRLGKVLLPLGHIQVIHKDDILLACRRPKHALHAQDGLPINPCSLCWPAVDGVMVSSSTVYSVVDNVPVQGELMCTTVSKTATRVSHADVVQQWAPYVQLQMFSSLLFCTSHSKCTQLEVTAKVNDDMHQAK